MGNRHLSNTNKAWLAAHLAKVKAMGFTWTGEIKSPHDIGVQFFRDGTPIYNLDICEEGAQGRGFKYTNCVALYRVKPYVKTEASDDDRRAIEFDVSLDPRTGEIDYKPIS
jgi:hypothetical protein